MGILRELVKDHDNIEKQTTDIFFNTQVDQHHSPMHFEEVD